MRGYCEAIKCKTCGQIYWDCACTIPKYCNRCGTELVAWQERTGDGFFTPCSYYVKYNSDNVERIVAKKTLFWWREREAKPL